MVIWVIPKVTSVYRLLGRGGKGSGGRERRGGEGNSKVALDRDMVYFNSEVGNAPWDCFRRRKQKARDAL